MNMCDYCDKDQAVVLELEDKSKTCLDCYDKAVIEVESKQ